MPPSIPGLRGGALKNELPTNSPRNPSTPRSAIVEIKHRLPSPQAADRPFVREIRPRFSSPNPAGDTHPRPGTNDTVDKKMKIPIAAIFNSVKASVVKHAPAMIEAAVERAGREIVKVIKKKISGRR